MLPDTLFKKSITSLLLRTYTLSPIGLSHGKAGISLVLFEAARYCNDASVEDHAFDLLREVLTYDIENNSLSTGKAGIAFALQYLIRNKLLDADYFELYHRQHTEIITGIKNPGHSKIPLLLHTYLDYCFFVECSSHISPIDQTECRKALKEYLSGKIKTFRNAHLFHQFSSRLLAICNHMDDPEFSGFFVNQIDEANDRWWASGIICDDPLFAIRFYLYGVANKHPDIIHKGEEMLHVYMQNHILSALTFRQRINLAVGIHQIYHVDRNMDYRSVADTVIRSVTDNDMDSLEQKINIFLNKKKLNLGLESGFCKLLLLHMYWNQIRNGIFSRNLILLEL